MSPDYVGDVVPSGIKHHTILKEIFQRGYLFHCPENANPDNSKGRLYVVLNIDPINDDPLYIITFTKQIPTVQKEINNPVKRLHENMARYFNRSQLVWLREESVVRCWKVERWPKLWFEQPAMHGRIEPRGFLPAAVLNDILDGVRCCGPDKRLKLKVFGESN